jgi:hypothetical protein
MTNKEQGLFTVAENEQLEKEIICVAEEGALDLPSQQEPDTSVFPEAPAESPPQEEKYRMKLPEKEVPAADDDKPKGWRNTKNVKEFMEFLQTEMERIPNMSAARGNQSLMERSLGQWKALDGHCSHALRGDYDSTLDVEGLDKARRFIESTIDQLEDALHGMSKVKKTRKQQRRRGEDAIDGMTKEATAPHFSGFQMVITPFQRAIVGSLINGTVSGGRNMEELYTDAAKKYKMDNREQLEILAILADFGYPIFKDRLRVGEDEDPSRDKGFGEWQSQYHG